MGQAGEMRVSVAFGDEQLDFEVPEERLVGSWHGPPGMPPEAVEGRVRAALEGPREFPPLRQAVVPGDRVVLALDPEVPDPGAILRPIVAVLRSAGVEPETIRVLAAEGRDPRPVVGVPPDVVVTTHDPEDRSRIAYLATTPGGRRVYLDRHLTDADLVVPIGRLGYDPVLGYRGPWSLIFPGLSDAETQRAFRAMVSDRPPDRARERPALAESAAVSWLLGSQFHVGVLGGAEGVAAVVAGLETAVRDAGTAAVDEAWAYRADRRADLVVAGIGRPWEATSLEDLAEGLTTAAHLVRRGGRIVALSRAEGPIGPALRRLIDAGETGPAPAREVLRGLEGAPDYPTARQLAAATAWADVYLLSALGEDLVEDLAMVALGKPEEARKLSAASPSCLFVSQADRVRAVAAEDEE